MVDRLHRDAILIEFCFLQTFSKLVLDRHRIIDRLVVEIR